jgi:hypothetical protein
LASAKFCNQRARRRFFRKQPFASIKTLSAGLPGLEKLIARHSMLLVDLSDFCFVLARDHITQRVISTEFCQNPSPVQLLRFSLYEHCYPDRADLPG